MKYETIKRIGSFPCAHRNHRHPGDCALVHGYAISFTFYFQSFELDEKGFVVDFGALKNLRRYLHNAYDHRVVLAEDDPELTTFRELEGRGLCKLTVLPLVTMEERAKDALLIARNGFKLPCYKVECWENETNCGAYTE